MLPAAQGHVTSGRVSDDGTQEESVDDHRMRARELGIPLNGEPGPWNAITDVPGIEVGYVTLCEGDDVRTGVTALLPRGRDGVGMPCARPACTRSTATAR